MFSMKERQGQSYYSILGVSSGSSIEEIKCAYHKLAMQWHPDRWTRKPSLLDRAKRKFQQIQEAYSVLSDMSKRTLYDAGFYDPEDEEDEGFSDFVQEMMSLMARERQERKYYTMDELQAMLLEMAQGFESSSWYSEPLFLNDLRHSKRMRCDSSSINDSSLPHFSLSDWTAYGESTKWS